ncbi:MAG TPA: hypothetical protein VJX92_12300, partial [Methylomirabilota bacterium]|nr:hypothetical protein [Methylomirabilota bacterium]
MSAARIGLFAHDGRLTVAAITGRGRVEHFVVEDADDPAATLAAELRTRGLTRGRVRVGLDRRVVVVKAIDLPRATGGDLGEMVAFDLERHVTFAPEDIRFDWVARSGDTPETWRALVAAADRRVL